MKAFRYTLETETDSTSVIVIAPSSTVASTVIKEQAPNIVQKPLDQIILKYDSVSEIIIQAQ